MTNIVLIGGGGHARVVIDILQSYHSLKLVGITEANAPRNPERHNRKIHEAIAGVPIIGDDSVLPELIRNGVSHAFIALGDNALRRKLFEKTTELGFQFVNAVHLKAVISSSVKLGHGNAIMGGVVINPDCVIADDAIINTGANIDHECYIADHVHIAPGVTLSGNVSVGAGAFIGAGATIVQGVHIGENAIIGAGAVVLHDVAPDTTVAGVPARVISVELRA